MLFISSVRFLRRYLLENLQRTFFRIVVPALGLVSDQLSLTGKENNHMI